MAQATVPSFSEQGTWTLISLSLVDNAGNGVSLTPAQVASAGLPTTFQVTGRGDTAAPSLVSFSLSPSMVDTSAGPATISFTARVTDDLSGVSNASAAFFSPSSAQAVGVNFGAGTRVSGDALDGTYVAQATVPAFSEQGTWTLISLSLVDNAGNGVSLTPAQVASAGLPTTFENGPPVSIAVTPANSTLPVGLTEQFKAAGRFKDGSTADLTISVSWVSSNPAEATITTSGEVTAKAVGDTTISASLVSRERSSLTFGGVGGIIGDGVDCRGGGSAG